MSEHVCVCTEMYSLLKPRQVSHRGRDLRCFRTQFLHQLQRTPQRLVKAQKGLFHWRKRKRASSVPHTHAHTHLAQFKTISLLLTSEAMFETVLHDDKELLERRVVWVQSSTEAQGRLDQPFNAQLGHVQQVGPLHGHGVSQGCRT